MEDIACQRLMWDSLENNINSLVDQATPSNIRSIATQLVSEDLIWGRGLFCRAILKSLMSSPNSAPVLAALVAAINTEFPDVGYLLLKRMLSRIKSGCRGSGAEKVRLLPVWRLLAQLVNHSVVYAPLALELLMFFLTVEFEEFNMQFVVNFILECGRALQDIAPQGLHSVFKCLDAILLEGEIQEVSRALIRGLIKIKRDGFSLYPGIPPELEGVVRLDDQVTHKIFITDEIDPEFSLDFFFQPSLIL